MVGLVVLSTVALVALGASVASSKPNPGGVSGQDVQITSAGPLTNIFISTQLNCQVDHIGYVLEGRMALKMDDGTEREFGPGDTFHMPPGHDAWIVGDEACVILDFGGLKGYAQAS